MFKPVKIAPSILSADFLHLGRDIELLESAGAGYVHIDVMDGHFVPNLTMGIPLIKQIKAATYLPLDVHLMISNPLEQLPWFLDAGADMVTVHAETLSASEIVHAVVLIHASGAKAALSLKPASPLCLLDPVLTSLDMVLIMSVEPGFSGQTYLSGSEERIASVVQRSRQKGVAPLIEVDGGISEANAALVAQAGADVLVCGNAIFAQSDPAASLKAIERTANSAREVALYGQKEYL